MFLYLSTGPERLTFNYRGEFEGTDEEFQTFAYWMAKSGLEAVLSPQLVLSDGAVVDGATFRPGQKVPGTESQPNAPLDPRGYSITRDQLRLPWVVSEGDEDQEPSRNPPVRIVTHPRPTSPRKAQRFGLRGV
jgi:hypothetical protein